MAHFEIVAAARHTRLAEGARIDISTAPFVIGRRNAAWVIDSYQLSRQHARVFPHGERWRIEDLSSSNGTLVNGRNAFPPVGLLSGDLVDMSAVIVRFHDGLPPDALPSHPGLEEAIAREPTTEAPWRVWTDWLLEQEHPLGSWLVARERPPSSLLVHLGPLARWQIHRRISTAWNPVGLLYRLRLPFVAVDETVNTVWALTHLHLVPAARFLVELEVELFPTALEARLPVETLLEALLRAPLPRSLRRIRFDGITPNAEPTRLQKLYMRPPPSALLERTFAALRARCPWLETGEKQLIQWDFA